MVTLTWLLFLADNGFLKPFQNQGLIMDKGDLDGRSID